MIRTRDRTKDRVTLVLEGEVLGPWVDELRRACDRALASHSAVTLDLGAVGFIDRAGLGLVRELERRQVRVTNCSPFVVEQLRGVAAR
jgi:ABC-type transporter Mla MlaB component